MNCIVCGNQCRIKFCSEECQKSYYKKHKVEMRRRYCKKFDDTCCEINCYVGKLKFRNGDNYTHNERINDIGYNKLIKTLDKLAIKIKAIDDISD